MDLRDVITISPLGMSKTFDFKSHTLIDSGLFFKDSEILTWDTTIPERIFAAGKTEIRGISSVDRSVLSIKCSSYELDSSVPIGISAVDELVVVGKASGIVSVFSSANLSMKCEISVAKNLSVCKSYQRHMICGGKDVLFSLWDLEKPTVPIFSAKNVRPDTLDLKVPIWISDASFVDGFENRIFVTSSKYGDFCVYDTRSGQRRPVSRSAWRVSRKHGKKSVGTGYNPAMLRDLAVTRPVSRCVAYTTAPGVGLRAIAGNAIGDICMLDFRVPHISLVTDAVADPRRKARSVGARAAAPPKHVQTYHPAAGSISALVCGTAGCANLPHLTPHAAINDQPVIVSASIDRYLRVYHRDSGELLNKIFTKFPISTFLIRDSAKFAMEPSDGQKSEESEAESNEIWASMESVKTANEPLAKRAKKSKPNKISVCL